MEADWKSVLADLRQQGSLSEGEETPQPQEEPRKSADKLRVIIDRKQRKGKTATIVEGFSCPDEDVAELAKRLKTRLGTGGSSRGGEILLQGDCREKCIALLRELGYTAT